MCRVIIFLIVVFLNINLSEASPLQARVTISRQIKFTIDNNIDNNIDSTQRVEIFVPYFGKIKGLINEFKGKSWDSYKSNQLGVSVQERKSLLLFNGVGRHRGKNIKFSGSIYPHAGRDYIHILFKGGSRHLRSYYIEAPLVTPGIDGHKNSVKIKKIPDFLKLNCGTEDLINQEIKSSDVESSDITSNSIPVVKISTEADPEYYAIYGDRTNDHIATLIHAASSIYEDTFGYGFKIEMQHVTTDSSSNPFTSNDSNTLLNQFQQHINKTAQLKNSSVYHLFSGKDWNGSVVGLAYVGVTCKYKEYSFSISQRFHDAADATILAHELGHNFGAGHDDANPSSIMGKVVSVPGATKFSQNSINQISNHLSGVSGCFESGEKNVENTPVPGNTPTSAPTNVPTAFPTPPPANNPASNPKVSISGSNSKNGMYKVNITVASIPKASCKVSLNAKLKSSGSETTIYTYNPKSLKSSVNVKVSKIDRFYLKAKYSCYPGVNPSESSLVKFSRGKLRKIRR